MGAVVIGLSVSVLLAIVARAWIVQRAHRDQWRGAAVPEPAASPPPAQRYGRPGDPAFCAGATSHGAVIAHAVVGIVDALHGRVIRAPMAASSARKSGDFTGRRDGAAGQGVRA